MILTIRRVQFPALQCFITLQSECEGPTVRIDIMVLNRHRNFVNPVSTHNDATVDQLRGVVIDILDVDIDDACTCGWRFTLKNINKGK